jgi:predicted nucleotidyltransferase
LISSEIESIISDTVSKLYKISGVVLIALYGSVARGDYDRRSDIDILLVFNSKKIREENEGKIIELYPDIDARVQIHQTSLDELEEEETSFIENLLKEATLLMVKPPLKLPIETILKLKPHILFTYETKGISLSKLVALHRKLYGYKERKRVGCKTRIYEHAGIVVKYGRKLGKNSLMVPRSGANEIRELFQQMGVKYQETEVWI